MKVNFFYGVAICSLFSITTIQGQVNYESNSIDPDNTSSVLGIDNDVNSAYYATAFGRKNVISSSYATASGLGNEIKGAYSYAFGLSNKIEKPFSFAAGRYTIASGINSFVFGKGSTANHELINSNDYSFMVGFEKDEPGFFVSRNNSGPIVGVATEHPQARLDVRLGDRQEVRIQSDVPNTYGSISFRHSSGNENWRIRAFSNFGGGYGNTLAISSGNKGNLWIVSEKTLIGDYFNFDACTDCNDYELFVRRGIRTEKIKVDIASGVWADYVFEEDYKLASLNEVEDFIVNNGHLPNMPSAEKIEKEGLNLGEMDVKLLEKIEELTLYVIALKKEINELKTQE